MFLNQSGNKCDLRGTHCVAGVQLIETEPPLIRFEHCAFETRSFPLINTLPSARRVIELSPHAIVTFSLAVNVSSTGVWTAADLQSGPIRPSTTPHVSSCEGTQSRTSSAALSYSRAWSDV